MKLIFAVKSFRMLVIGSIENKQKDKQYIFTF